MKLYSDEELAELLDQDIFHQISEAADRLNLECYVVGGYVRDIFLERPSNDIDVVVVGSGIAVAEELKRMVGKKAHLSVFKNFGTAQVKFRQKGREYEVEFVGARKESYSHDSRKPVVENGTLEDDQNRRDFTINAMAYNDSQGLVDLFGGEADLQSGIIKAVGDPVERFTEDALRMLRALRFSAQLGFDIEDGTYQAIKKLAPTLERISAERIQVEMVKLVTSDHPERLRDVYETGLTKVFFPEFDEMMECQQVNKHHMYTVGEHTIVSMGIIAPDKVLRLAMMLHDIAKPACKTTDENGQNHFKMHPVKGTEMARNVLRRLKFDNETTDRVCNLVKNHDDRPEINQRNVRRMIIRVGQENFNDLLAVKRADCLAQSMYHRQEKLAYIEELEKVFNEIIEAGDCLKIKDLKINGKDLISMGVPQGQRIGEVLKAIFDEVVENPQLNDRETLLTMANNMIK